MMKKSFAIATLLVLASCNSTPEKPTEAPAETVQVSQDCVHWTSPSSLPTTGFYRSNGSVSFVDYPNRTYAIYDQNGGAPAVFDYSEEGWIHMSSDMWIQSAPAHLDVSPDKIGDMMVQLTAFARKNLASNQWAVLLGQGNYIATFNEKPCSLEPRARGAACRPNDGFCTLAPASVDKPGVAKKCLKELGFLDGKLRSSLEKTCAHYLDPAARNRLADITSRSRTCPAIEAPAVQRTFASVCRDMNGFFAHLLH